MFSVHGVPTREINGLPYSVQQIDDSGACQIVIQNCMRHPAGYAFAPVYGTYRDAVAALQQWRGEEEQASLTAGDDTGSIYSAYFED